MNTIENLFLDLGFSWTISKLLPYILTVILGLILVYVIKKTLKRSKKWVKILIQFILFVAPFGLYFTYSPIYVGDFSNASVSVEKLPDHAELTGQKLAVISIPGCKYCYQAIDQLKKLKERVPEATIEMIVCSKDSITLDWYREKAGDAITVRLATHGKAMAKLANHQFPTYVLVNNDKDIKKWSNDAFGVVAMDEVELLLK